MLKCYFLNKVAEMFTICIKAKDTNPIKFILKQTKKSLIALIVNKLLFPRGVKLKVFLILQ